MAGRSICNLGFIERPLLLGLLWWIWTGDYSVALPLAVFFELFWIDLIPIGSYIPPMPAFPYLVLLSLTGIFQWTGPVSIALPLLLSLPLAYLVPYIESRQRNFQKAAYSKLLTQAKKIEPLGILPGALLSRSAVQQLGIGIFLFYGAAAAMYFLLSVPLGGQSFPLSDNAGWAFLYGVAAVGALVALRIRRAYLVFILCTGALMLSAGVFC